MSSIRSWNLRDAEGKNTPTSRGEHSCNYFISTTFSNYQLLTNVKVSSVRFD